MHSIGYLLLDMSICQAQMAFTDLSHPPADKDVHSLHLLKTTTVFVLNEISQKPSSRVFDIVMSSCQTAIFINVNRHNLTLNLALALYLET